MGSHVIERSLAEKQLPMKISDSQKLTGDIIKGLGYISFCSAHNRAELKILYTAILCIICLKISSYISSLKNFI